MAWRLQNGAKGLANTKEVKVEARMGRKTRWRVLAGIIVACGVGSTPASAGPFTARETHRGLVIDRADGTTSRLMSLGWFGGGGLRIGCIYCGGRFCLGHGWV